MSKIFFNVSCLDTVSSHELNDIFSKSKIVDPQEGKIIHKREISEKMLQRYIFEIRSIFRRIFTSFALTPE